MSGKLLHGGDWAGFEREYGYEPLDFSANVSPLGVPEGVQRAIADSAVYADRYPDPLCRSLREAIAGYEGVKSDWIFCGNGAADIIFRLAVYEHGKHALVTAPTFAEYEESLVKCGCTVARYLLKEEKNFRVDDGILDEIREGTDLVFLCQPNNPTGITMNRDFLLRVLRKCEEVGSILVIDECFADFIDDPDSKTMKRSLGDTKNLLILKAYTKVFAMAGVRLGYCMSSNEELLDGLRLSGQPWPVSEIAQQAGVAALRETEYVKGLNKMIRTERPVMIEALESSGLKVIHGEANYLLFKGPEDLDDRLRKRGVLIRSCANYPGLGQGWFRCAVRKHDENTRFIEVLREELECPRENM